MQILRLLEVYRQLPAYWGRGGDSSLPVGAISGWCQIVGFPPDVCCFLSCCFCAREKTLFFFPLFGSSVNERQIIRPGNPQLLGCFTSQL